jgi:hypothetical protein
MQQQKIVGRVVFYAVHVVGDDFFPELLVVVYFTTLSVSAGCPKSVKPMAILFIIYYLLYTCMLYMFTPTHYAFSQPLYHVCADFVQRIGIDSSTTVCNSLPKVTKISDFNSIHHP